MMQTKNDLFAILSGLQLALVSDGAALPPHTVQHIADAFGDPSPRNRIVAIGEALWAAQEALTPKLRELCAQCFDLMAEQSWLHESITVFTPETAGRADRIIQALKRDDGEKPMSKSWPTAETDPAPVTAFALQEVIDSSAAMPAAGLS